MGTRFFPYRGGDTIGGEEGIEAVVGDDDAVIGVVEGRGESTAYHVAEDIEEDDIEFVEGVEFFEEFDGFADDQRALWTRFGHTLKFLLPD